MPGDILIVDTVATNRIVLKVKLVAAQHRVRPCESLALARAEVAASPPDLILLDITAETEESLAFCREIAQADSGLEIPIIATGAFLTPADRVRALRCGADDVLTRPFNDNILQARVRSLLRARDAGRELRLRDETSAALGFAEAAPGYAPEARITALSHDPVFLQTQRQTFANLSRDRIETLSLGGGAGLSQVHTSDLLILDGRDMPGGDGDLFRLLSEIRSRSETRHAAVLVILPADAHETGAMALDLGANALATTGAVPEEIALRARALIRDKQRSDLLRRTVRSGLEAAVTDPLTGLFNRRYALPHLRKMADRARQSGNEVAVMVLDIDHFKAINDTHGHAAGDQVLRQVAERLRVNVRAVDLLARIGGEEFLIAVPESDATHARTAAERLCRVIAEAPFFVTSGPNGDPTEIGVTMSIGVSLSNFALHDLIEETPDELVHAADLALYAAKGSGRNTVSLSAA